MSITRISSPTRIERSNQIAHLKTAKRGHKLLKDKQEEMVRKLQNMRQVRDGLRTAVYADIGRTVEYFLTAKARMAPAEIENAIAAHRTDYSVDAGEQNIMGLAVPVLNITPNDAAKTDVEKTVAAVNAEKPTFTLTTPQSFDRAAETLKNVMDKIDDLASAEKSCTMLEHMINSLRRRTNALEYSVMPKIQSNIQEITLKLAENERGNLVRMMKVKEMLDSGADI